MERQSRWLVLLSGASAAVTAALVYLRSRSARRPLLTLGYWDIRGLAAPARMMLVYSGCDFEDRTYELQRSADGEGWDGTTWFKESRPALRVQNAFINLPYVVDHGTGLVVAQSTAVYQYLGRKLRLMGSNEAEVAGTEQVIETKLAHDAAVYDRRRLRRAPAATCRGAPAGRGAASPSEDVLLAGAASASDSDSSAAQVLAQAFDLRTELVRIVYPFWGTDEKMFLSALKRHLKNLPASHFDKFEHFLGDKPFFVGNAPSAGDFHVWETLSAATLDAKPPPLRRWSARRSRGRTLA